MLARKTNEIVKTPLSKRCDELEARLKAQTERIERLEEHRASLERRASRHAEHLAKLESRVQAQERGGR